MIVAGPHSARGEPARRLRSAQTATSLPGTQASHKGGWLRGGGEPRNVPSISPEDLFTRLFRTKRCPALFVYFLFRKCYFFLKGVDLIITCELFITIKLRLVTSKLRGAFYAPVNGLPQGGRSGIPTRFDMRGQSVYERTVVSSSFAAPAWIIFSKIDKFLQNG